MKKMSVNEAAAHFGISKEAIHNRIRRGSLEALVENGVKYVIVDETSVKKPQVRVKATSSVNDERYYRLLEEQNNKLQSRVAVLEDETRTLRDQKELMLIEERQKIENIYKEKDEQLKNILASISSQFMLNAPQQVEEEHVDAEIEIVEENELEEIVEASKVISLKKYLKKLKLSAKKEEKIRKRFQKLHNKKDERIIVYGKKYYVDVKKFSYDDLI